MDSCGWIWADRGGYGRICMDMAGCGWISMDIDGYRWIWWVWVDMGGYGLIWVDMAGYGWIWAYGRTWADMGEYGRICTHMDGRSSIQASCAGGWRRRSKRRLFVAEKVRKRVQAKTKQAQKSRSVNTNVKELRAKATAGPGWDARRCRPGALAPDGDRTSA